MAAVPRAITRAPLRTVRPRDLRDLLANPHATTRRLVATGDLVRLAHGYLMAVPDDARADWRPTLEAAAMGIAVSIFGTGAPVLMGVSAARIHHAIPRALGVAVVAAPDQHRALELEIGGRVIFVKRDTSRLDASLERMETGRGLVTTREQTIIDLAKRPDLGGLREDALRAIKDLAPLVDMEKVRRLAQDQHAPTAAALVERAVE